MKRSTRILKILAVNVLLLGIGIVLIELAFGGWLKTGNLNRLSILKGRAYKYDVSHLYKDPIPVITYSRDPYGLRGTHATPARIDLLTVGGSTTDQRFIRDGETWQDVLQKRFEQAGVSVIVANAGIDGQSSFGHIMNFKWWFPHIPGLKAKYILFYVGINDFHKDANYSHDDLTGDGRKFRLRRVLSENSVLWTLARTLLGAWEAMVVKDMGHSSVDFKKVIWTRQAIQSDYQVMQPRLNAYADRLRILADLTYALGAKPIFVSQPDRHYRVTPDGIEGQSGVSVYDDREINGVDHYHMMRKLDRVTEAVAIEKGALFIDLASYKDWTDADFYDWAHMTPQGAERVGNHLFEALSRVIPGGEQPARPEK
jgi:lysophospholipase L1-like esterase